MRGYNKWNYRPYIPLDRNDAFLSPYICRVAPGENDVLIEWLDNTDVKGHTLFYKERTGDTWEKSELENKNFVISGLKTDTEYELYVENSNGYKSDVRIAKTGFVPGQVINYLHPDDKCYSFSGNYLCSPSLVRLPSGKLLLSMDVFGHSMPQNLSIIYESTDNGETWSYLTELFPCFWGKLFMHKGNLYSIAASTEYGDLLIGRSDDEGKTWSMPTVIHRGSSQTIENGLHKAPCVILNAKGRIWLAVDYGSWKHKEFSNALYSIDENDDLMVAENWCCTGFLPHDKNLPGALPIAGAIEGAILETPDGDVINFLRYADNKAYVIKADSDNPEKMPEFSHIADFPMGHTKFDIIKHTDGFYYAIGNRLPLRNILSIYKSEDLKEWIFVKDILNYENLDKQYNGFQYPAVILEGDDMIIASRTAFNGAFTYHDNNYITLHRTKLSD